MIILEKIKEFCFNIATLFGLGRFFARSIIATLISFPLIFLGRFFYNILPINIFFWLAGSLFILSLFVLYMALGFVTQQDKSSIVLNKTIGMIFVFIGIPLQNKHVLVGFMLFHFVGLLAPYIFYKLFNKKIESLPVHVGPVFGDIVYGIICNIFLKFLILVLL